MEPCGPRRVDPMPGCGSIDTYRCEENQLRGKPVERCTFNTKSLRESSQQNGVVHGVEFRG